MDYILLIINILLSAAQGMFCKAYSDNAKGSSKNSSFTYAALLGLTNAIIIFAISGFKFSARGITVLIGLEQALVFFIYNIVMVRALLTGASYSFMSISAQSGVLILSLLETRFIFGNDLGIAKITAILLIIVSFFIINYDGIKAHDIKISYVIYYALLFVLNGIYSVMLDIHQQITVGEERSELMIITYLFSAIFAVIAMTVKNRKLEVSEFAQTKKSVFFLVLSSAVASYSIFFILYLLGKINVAVVYSMCNGGTLVVATIYSAIFLKEKMPPLKIIGILITVGCIVALSIM